MRCIRGDTYACLVKRKWIGGRESEKAASSEIWTKHFGMDLPSINTKGMEATACGLRVRLRLRTSDETRRSAAEGMKSSPPWIRLGEGMQGRRWRGGGKNKGTERGGYVGAGELGYKVQKGRARGRHGTWRDERWRGGTDELASMEKTWRWGKEEKKRTLVHAQWDARYSWIDPSALWSSWVFSVDFVASFPICSQPKLARRSKKN
jgi:hypothetical protein